MFATRSPPAVQRIPWPAIDDDEEPNSPGQHAPYFGFDSWLLNDEELPWLVDPDGLKCLHCYFVNIGLTSR